MTMTIPILLQRAAPPGRVVVPRRRKERPLRHQDVSPSPAEPGRVLVEGRAAEPRPATSAAAPAATAGRWVRPTARWLCCPPPQRPPGSAARACPRRRSRSWRRPVRLACGAAAGVAGRPSTSGGASTSSTGGRRMRRCSKPPGPSRRGQSPRTLSRRAEPAPNAPGMPAPVAEAPLPSAAELRRNALCRWVAPRRGQTPMTSTTSPTSTVKPLAGRAPLSLRLRIRHGCPGLPCRRRSMSLPTTEQRWLSRQPTAEPHTKSRASVAAATWCSSPCPSLATPPTTTMPSTPRGFAPRYTRRRHSTLTSSWLAPCLSSRSARRTPSPRTAARRSSASLPASRGRFTSPWGENPSCSLPETTSSYPSQRSTDCVTLASTPWQQSHSAS
mmetsp:Transcript_9776/g.38058  ORF Transcript_9776/g.38058 Transcript_9776/m.38058 type:complete len:386 (-) Transcript_9776:308-1465(-)